MGMPVAFAIGISAVMFYIFGPVPTSIAIQKITTVTQSFPLLAVPLFVFRRAFDERSGDHGAPDQALDRPHRLDAWRVGDGRHHAERPDGWRLGFRRGRCRDGSADSRAGHAQGGLHQGLCLRGHCGRFADHGNHSAEYRSDSLWVHGQRLDWPVVRRRSGSRRLDDHHPDGDRVLGRRQTRLQTHPQGISFRSRPLP